MLSSLGKLCEAAGWDRDGLQDGLLAVVDASIASANFHNAVSMLKFLHPHLNKFLKPDGTASLLAFVSFLLCLREVRCLAHP